MKLFRIEDDDADTVALVEAESRELAEALYIETMDLDYISDPFSSALRCEDITDIPRYFKDSDTGLILDRNDLGESG